MSHVSEGHFTFLAQPKPLCLITQNWRYFRKPDCRSPVLSTQPHFVTERLPNKLLLVWSESYSPGAITSSYFPPRVAGFNWAIDWNKWVTLKAWSACLWNTLRTCVMLVGCYYHCLVLTVTEFRWTSQLCLQPPIVDLGWRLLPSSTSNCTQTLGNFLHRCTIVKYWSWISWNGTTSDVTLFSDPTWSPSVLWLPEPVGVTFNN